MVRAVEILPLGVDDDDMNDDDTRRILPKIFKIRPLRLKLGAKSNENEGKARKLSLNRAQAQRDII